MFFDRMSWTDTKPITLASHNKREQRNQPITIRNLANTNMDQEQSRVRNTV